ncbi:YusU family protein [Bacillus sp. ISL-51]|uniref:YusU family protein n=1 Tax=Bacteria TaxID=2 RepID=UPI001BEBFF9B|nr:MULTISPECIES: YusU family protein [Bacteria]MBT2574770.1 YusU family protein [Bacillus sp. ISL-51]MBT2635649.1 YusU family protein [Bacillus sp. ISL-26]MBT2714275.1 YusU family protein [Pseudomonas sp. ISL-88]
MEEKLQQQLDGLLEKYTELLLGETDHELKEEVKQWILYTHIAKSMPPLVKHWNESYPDAKQGMKDTIQHIKQLNEKHRNKQ